MLTAAQIDEYRKRLKDKEWMDIAVNKAADKILKVVASGVNLDVNIKTNQMEVKAMARNKLSDLNDHLMEQIEWLTDREIKGEALTEEIKRSDALSRIAPLVIANANLILKACVAVENSPSGKMKLPFMIEDKT